MLPSTIATLNTAIFTFTEPNRCQRIEDIMALKREKREEECATMVVLVLKKKHNFYLHLMQTKNEIQGFLVPSTKLASAPKSCYNFG